MIATVGLAPDALLDDLETSPAALAQLHRAVTRCLLAHAELTFADSSDERNLREAVQSLAAESVDAAKAWEAVLTHGRRRRVNSDVTSLSEIEQVRELRSEWRPLIELAIVESVRAELFGCAPDQLSHVDESGLEIAKCKANWDTRTFAALRELSDRHVVCVGTPRDDIAKHYFSPVLRRARHVAMLDRFLGPNLVKSASTAGIQRPREFEWLLRLIDERAVAATVSVFTTVDPEADPPAAENDIRDAAEKIWRHVQPSGGLRRLTIFTAPVNVIIDGRAMRFPHERHLRASTSTGAVRGFTLSAGFDRLRPPAASQDWRLFYMWKTEDTSALQAEEERAKRLSVGQIRFDVASGTAAPGRHL
jgi:hypothetical protein